MKNEVLRETKRKDRVSKHLGALSIHVPRGYTAEHVVFYCSNPFCASEPVQKN